jgi:hypothetical protein
LSLSSDGPRADLSFTTRFKINGCYRCVFGRLRAVETDDNSEWGRFCFATFWVFGFSFSAGKIGVGVEGGDTRAVPQMKA